jgi:hypothetical protein
VSARCQARETAVRSIRLHSSNYLDVEIVRAALSPVRT